MDGELEVLKYRLKELSGKSQLKRSFADAGIASKVRLFSTSLAQIGAEIERLGKLPPDDEKLNADKGTLAHNIEVAENTWKELEYKIDNQYKEPEDEEKK